MTNQKADVEITPLMTCVTPITIMKGDTFLGRATGFFFVNEEQLFLITNRHVVVEEAKQFHPDTLIIRVHADKTDLRKNVDLPLALHMGSKPVWKEFDKSIDVVAIPLNRELAEEYVVLSFPSQSLPPPDIEIELGQDLLVLGYPLGFHDEVHNLPVVRSATLASVYPAPFGGMPYFVIDARLHPGTSGSPVITKPTPIVKLKSGTGHAIGFGGSHTFLLGIHSHTWPVPRGEEPLGLNAVWFASLIVELTKQGG